MKTGHSPTVVNHFIAAANGHLDYVHARKSQLTDVLKASRKPRPELTRNEYLRLLSAAQAGMLGIGNGSSREIIRLLECICRELLDYAERQKIQSGPIPHTRDGMSMSRYNVTISIRQLCGAVGVPEEKGSPRCLRKLYLSTRAEPPCWRIKCKIGSWRRSSSLWGWEMGSRKFSGVI